MISTRSIILLAPLLALAVATLETCPPGSMWTPSSISSTQGDSLSRPLYTVLEEDRSDLISIYETSSSSYFVACNTSAVDITCASRLPVTFFFAPLKGMATLHVDNADGSSTRYSVGITSTRTAVIKDLFAATETVSHDSAFTADKWGGMFKWGGNVIAVGVNKLSSGDTHPVFLTCDADLDSCTHFTYTGSKMSNVRMQSVVANAANGDMFFGATSHYPSGFDTVLLRCPPDASSNDDCVSMAADVNSTWSIRPHIAYDGISNQVIVAGRQGPNLRLLLCADSLDASCTEVTLSTLDVRYRRPRPIVVGSTLYIVSAGQSDTLGTTGTYIHTCALPFSTCTSTMIHSTLAAERGISQYALSADPVALYITFLSDETLGQITTLSCQTERCHSNPCKHGSTCNNDRTLPICTCTPGASGLHCDIVGASTACQSGPCQNGAICVPADNDFRCMCSPGYAGAVCAENVNECASQPCANGATCLDGVNGYTCACHSGYIGYHCQIDVDECISSPCHNLGTCVDAANGFACLCMTGYSGVACESDIDTSIADLLSIPSSATPESMAESSDVLHTIIDDGNWLAASNRTRAAEAVAASLEQLSQNALQASLNLLRGNGSVDPAPTDFALDALHMCDKILSTESTRTVVLQEWYVGPTLARAASIALRTIVFGSACGELVRSSRQSYTSFDYLASRVSSVVDLATDHALGGVSVRVPQDFSDEYAGEPNLVPSSPCSIPLGLLVYSGVPFPTRRSNNGAASNNSNTSNDTLVLDSSVVSFSAGATPVSDLSKNASVLLRIPIGVAPANGVPSGATRRCMYWSYVEDGWASDGCTLVKETATHVLCRCNHLTNFAVLFEPPSSNTSPQGPHDADECASQPCLNNATCTDRRASFFCTCASGFTGALCQIDMDNASDGDCQSNPCANSGICVSAGNGGGDSGYRCICPRRFSGTHCEQVLSYVAIMSQLVDAMRGGKIRSGQLEVDVPLGALTRNTTISVGETLTSNLENEAMPFGLTRRHSSLYVFGPPSNFSIAVRVTLPVTPLGRSSRYRMFYRRDGGPWEEADGLVEGSGTLSGNLYHFSSVGVWSEPINDTLAVATNIISWLGSVLSIICCLLLLLIFALFPTLRTAPIRMIMHLSAALVCTHLIFLVAIDRDESRVGCTIAKLVLYYFLMSVFLWMGCISVHLYRSLVRGKNMKDVRHGVRKSALVAWLLPLVPTVAIGIYDGVTDASTTASGVCWFVAGPTLTAVFVAPVAILLTTNIVFLVRCFAVLYQSHRVRQRLASPEMIKATHYVRSAIVLSITVGVTWIVAYIALATQVRALWLVFALVNGFQGVWLFIAYCLNSRVRMEMHAVVMSWKDTMGSRTNSTSARNTSSHRGASNAARSGAGAGGGGSSNGRVLPFTVPSYTSSADTNDSQGSDVEPPMALRIITRGRFDSIWEDDRSLNSIVPNDKLWLDDNISSQRQQRREDVQTRTTSSRPHLSRSTGTSPIPFEEWSDNDTAVSEAGSLDQLLGDQRPSPVSSPMATRRCVSKERSLLSPLTSPPAIVIDRSTCVRSLSSSPTPRSAHPAPSPSSALQQRANLAHTNLSAPISPTSPRLLHDSTAFADASGLMVAQPIEVSTLARIMGQPSETFLDYGETHHHNT